MNLFTDPNVIVGMTVATVGMVVRAWVSLHKARLREESLTDRLTRALKDTSPRERAEIIRALGTLADQPRPVVEGDRLVPARRTPSAGE